MVHRPSHWVAVALVAGLALLAFEAAGQMSMGSTAMFEGRPSLAGAQGGLGAQAGPPQGGIGVQGTEATGMNLRKPRIIDEPRDMPQGEPVALAPEAPKKLEPDTTPMEARAIARAGR